ncbi:MAG: ABC transporter ATP-binding protein [Rhodospirillaceae bacterium]|nr:ABC transporter ATP-binding protein [Rhodospirillaceae bacterium]
MSRDVKPPPTPPLLVVENLAVTFGQGASAVQAVRGISFTLERGESLALVGESGSGKSATALSILQLLPYPKAHHPKGRIRFKGHDLLGANEKTLRSVRGGRIGMVFQEPMSSLNPLHAIERQIGEALTAHGAQGNAGIKPRVIELLRKVGFPDAEQRLGALPHELSGGQRQRVMLAMALANTPDLLIADEPTTALDVTIQAQILALLRELRAQMGLSLLFITHDLAIARAIADRVCVMKDGQIIEQGSVAEVLSNPKHDYTRQLVQAQPKPQARSAAVSDTPVMIAENLKCWFPIRRGIIRRTVGHIKAVDGVSLSLKPGRTLGVVGESGSGKSALALALLRLAESEGAITFEGQRIDGLKPAAMRPLRRQIQIVFQDPFGSLSPRLSIREIVGEGLSVHDKLSDVERDARVAEALTDVGLDSAIMDRYPHEFSGGQRQRIAIARALVLRPKVLVLDEPTSALDVSVQAQLIDLLRALQTKYGMAYLFISHDLRVIRAMADDVMVMKDGTVQESGPAATVLNAPTQAYTQALMAAAFELKAV